MKRFRRLKHAPSARFARWRPAYIRATYRRLNLAAHIYARHMHKV